jgi:hypothetical protein
MYTLYNWNKRKSGPNRVPGQLKIIVTPKNLPLHSFSRKPLNESVNQFQNCCFNEIYE